MTIKTIYKVGDEVWTMSDNKPIKARIKNAYFDNPWKEEEKINMNLEDYLKWELDYKEYIMDFICPLTYNIRRKESELFLTRKELLDSLNIEN